MTTREFTPRLDRQITRIVKGASPGLNPLRSTRCHPRVRQKSRYGPDGQGLFSGKDFSQVVQGGIISVRDTRYVVRVESGPWAAGDTFVDEDGERLVVQGVQQIGRQYLELLARSGGL